MALSTTPFRSTLFLLFLVIALTTASRTSPRLLEAAEAKMFDGLTEQDTSTIFALAQQDVKPEVIVAAINEKRSQAEVADIVAVLKGRHESKLKSIGEGNKRKAPPDYKNKNKAQAAKAEGKGGAKSGKKSGAGDVNSGKGRENQKRVKEKEKQKRTRDVPDWKREAEERNRR